MVANQGEKALLRDNAHAGAQLVNDDQRDRRHSEHPQQAIAELAAGIEYVAIPAGSSSDRPASTPGLTTANSAATPPARSNRRRRRTRCQCK